MSTTTICLPLFLLLPPAPFSHILQVPVSLDLLSLGLDVSDNNLDAILGIYNSQLKYTVIQQPATQAAKGLLLHYISTILYTSLNTPLCANRVPRWTPQDEGQIDRRDRQADNQTRRQTDLNPKRQEK